jgi:hypothetical protein
MADGWKKREVVCGLALALAIGAGTTGGGGCVRQMQNPAATQPVTAVDPATTQPSYWLAQPAVAQIRGKDFDAVWDVCKTTARSYLFTLDRDDYRAGVITTVPMVSKQPLEVWRRDAGTTHDVYANALSTIRRTLRFEVARAPDGNGYVATPKVLVERVSVIERRVSDVSQYRTAFTPQPKTPPKMAVTFDPDVYADAVPFRYWTSIGRDEPMERQVAERFERALAKREAQPPVSPVTPPTPPVVATNSPRLEPDGQVSATGPGGAVYVNVGATDKVVVGMTFEVYDARAALPTLDAYARDNPQSKGWVEVTAVNNGSSACKVIAARGSEAPKAGDQIVNFIFRRQRPNRFAVFGDLTSDRQTVTGLIERWGGTVDTRVSSDTDYVILGRPPEGQTARDVYDTAKANAEQLKIPIVTEERFDLFVRYYDPSKK